MENITERIKLLMNYDNRNTLTENINIIKEQGARDVTKTIATAFKDILSAEKGLFSTFKNEIPLFSKFSTADDLLKELSAVEAGTSKITSTELIGAAKKLAKDSPEIISKLKGQISKSETFKDIAKQVYPNGTLMSVNADKLAVVTKYYEQIGLNAKQIEEMLKSNLQSGTSKIVSKFKGVKGGDPALKGFVKDVPNVANAAKNVEQVAEAGLNPSTFQKIGQKIGFYGTAGFTRIKSLIPKMTFKNLVKYGLIGYGTYAILEELFGDEPNPSVLDPCVVNSDKVELLPTTSGDIMGFVKETGNEEYDKMGGLKFYSNGRVLTGDLSKRGKYSCSTGGQIKLGESTKKKKLNEETVLGNIEINWDVPGGGNESSSTGSSTGSFKRECGDPYSRGCKETDPNGPLHKVQGCIGVKSDGLFGGKTEGALLTKTQSKTFMAKDVDKICTSSGGGGTQQPTQDPEYTIDTQNSEAGETEDEGV